uniref:Uncharacterized protein n=1 Tax=Manihot esculenta TaxID=3983 RepID=A0A2C9W686_MANES
MMQLSLRPPASVGSHDSLEPSTASLFIATKSSFFEMGDMGNFLAVSRDVEKR